MKRILILSGIAFLSVALNVRAETIQPTTAKSFAKFMKIAIEAKDAPATCWYLGLFEGYLYGMKNSGDSKASKLLAGLRESEGKCGGKNSMDLNSTFTRDEWLRLSDVQKKIESVEL